MYLTFAWGGGGAVVTLIEDSNKKLIEQNIQIKKVKLISKCIEEFKT